jgi:hypothetical protein
VLLGPILLSVMTLSFSFFFFLGGGKMKEKHQLNCLQSKNIK